MAERLVLSLREPVQAHKAFDFAWRQAKALLMAGHRMVLEIKPEKRSNDQNKKLHALIADVARQAEWHGKHDSETWKRLFVSAWCRTHGEAVTVLPALDGHGVDLVPRRTSKLTKPECADLIEYITAWAVDNGVELADATPELEVA